MSYFCSVTHTYTILDIVTNCTVKDEHIIKSIIDNQYTILSIIMDITILNSQILIVTRPSKGTYTYLTVTYLKTINNYIRCTNLETNTRTTTINNSRCTIRI